MAGFIDPLGQMAGLGAIGQQAQGLRGFGQSISGYEYMREINLRSAKMTEQAFLGEDFSPKKIANSTKTIIQELQSEINDWLKDV